MCLFPIFNAKYMYNILALFITYINVPGILLFFPVYRRRYDMFFIFREAINSNINKHPSFFYIFFVLMDVFTSTFIFLKILFMTPNGSNAGKLIVQKFFHLYPGGQILDGKRVLGQNHPRLKSNCRTFSKQVRF